MSQSNPHTHKRVIPPFNRKAIDYQLEVLRAIEQNLVAKSRLHDADLASFYLPGEDRLTFIMRSSIEEIQKTTSNKCQANIMIVKGEIKELQARLDELEQWDRMRKGVEGFVEAAGNLEVIGIRKRKLDDFDELVKHAQRLVELNKKLKTGEGKESGEAAER